MSKVSVVIPAHNYGHFVSDAIRSVLCQDYSDLEVIVVDDGSRDNTAEVVHSIIDPRLRYIYQDSRGLSSARNTGIRAASGRYVAFLDADDLWLPGKLALQVPLLDAFPKIGLVYGGYYLVDEHGNVLATRRATSVVGPILRQLVRGNVVSGSATTSTVRRTILEQTGLFNESLRALEDWDMWLRIAKISEFDRIPEPIAKIRIHNLNMSSNAQRMESSLFNVLEAFYSDTTLTADIQTMKVRAFAGAHFQSGVFHARSGSVTAAIAHLIKAIGLDPGFIDCYVVLMHLLVRRRLPKSLSPVPLK